MRRSTCSLTTCSLISLLSVVLVYVALIDKVSNDFHNSAFARHIVRRTEAEEQHRHHRHLTTVVVTGKDQNADERDMEYPGSAGDAVIFQADETGSNDDEEAVVTDRGVSTRPVSIRRLQKRQELTDEKEFRDETDMTSDLNLTLSTTYVANNTTAQIGGVEISGSGQNSSSEGGIKLPTDSTDTTYLKVIKSLKKLLGIDIDDNQLNQQQQPTTETNVTNTTTTITSEANVTVATPISVGEPTTTVELPQPTNQTSRPPTWQTTSDQRLWWNASCWRSSVAEPDDDLSGTCDDDRLEGLRNMIFDTAALSRLRELCQPGEWCLKDRIEFGRLTTSDEIRQLCNISNACAVRLQSKAQQCDVRIDSLYPVIVNEVSTIFRWLKRQVHYSVMKLNST